MYHDIDGIIPVADMVATSDMIAMFLGIDEVTPVLDMVAMFHEQTVNPDPDMYLWSNAKWKSLQILGLYFNIPSHIQCCIAQTKSLQFPTWQQYSRKQTKSHQLLVCYQCVMA